MHVEIYRQHAVGSGGPRLILRSAIGQRAEDERRAEQYPRDRPHHKPSLAATVCQPAGATNTVMPSDQLTSRWVASSFAAWAGELVPLRRKNPKSIHSDHAAATAARPHQRSGNSLLR